MSSVIGSIVLAAALLPACEAFEDITGDDDGASDARPAGVARGAELMESGRGDLSFTAPSRGAVYAVDATTGRLLTSREVRAGQVFALDLGDDEIQVDGDAIVKRDLKSDHRHAIWFRPDGRVGDTDVDRDVPRELRNARKVATARGELHFTAPEDGEVLLYDRSSKAVVYRARIDTGQRLHIDAAGNRIELDGQIRSASTAQKNRLYGNREYTLYFDEK